LYRLREVSELILGGFLEPIDVESWPEMAHSTPISRAAKAAMVF
jgi:hypothetical protein